MRANQASRLCRCCLDQVVSIHIILGACQGPHVSEIEEGDFVIPTLRPASRSNSRHSLQVCIPHESPSTSGDFLISPVRPASRSSLRHSLQVSTPQEGAATTDVSNAAGKSSSRHSLQISLPQETASATDFPIAASKPESRSSSRHSLHAQQDTPSIAAETCQATLSNISSISRTSSNLDQLLPDLMLHAAPSQTAQQAAQQKRSIPLIQQPGRPASASSASRIAHKQTQGFRPQQDWVGMGSKKSPKK